jgi:hypothetical protein
LIADFQFPMTDEKGGRGAGGVTASIPHRKSFSLIPLMLLQKKICVNL